MSVEEIVEDIEYIMNGMATLSPQQGIKIIAALKAGAMLRNNERGAREAWDEATNGGE